MKIKESIGIIIAGCAAGVVNGLFGAGGGLILVPMLSRYADIDENQVFPCSVSIILPLSVISIFTNIRHFGTSLAAGWPYLIGGIVGGLFAAFYGQRVSVKFLHKVLGILILWGGIRYLC